MASQTGKRSGHKLEILMLASNWRMVSLFSFIVMLLYIYYVSQDFGKNVCYSQGKKIEWGGGGGRGALQVSALW